MAEEITGLEEGVADALTDAVAGEVVPDERSRALAQPIDFDRRHGRGKSHALVLGGGGLFFVAWQVGYLEGLSERGVDLGKAQILVGTSAGSLVAAIVAAGHLHRTAGQIDLLGKVPALLGLLAGGGDLAPSQLRALDRFATATDAEPETLQAIGRTALAAHAPPARRTRLALAAVLALRRWPSPALHMTAADAFSGERLVIRHDSDIPVSQAAAASSAVPGLFSPQPLHDRWAVDGGVSGSGIHADLVAGAERVLVISLTGTVAQPEAAMTVAPGSQDREVEALEAAGGQALLRGPSRVDRDELMDPKAVSDALQLGDQQAADDADEVLALWR